MQVRDWIHVEDHCGRWTHPGAGRAGEVYNVGAENEHANLDVVRAILRLPAPTSR